MQRKTARPAKRPGVLFYSSVHLLSAGEVDGAVLHGVHVVQTLASAVGHAGDGVVGHMGKNAMNFFNQRMLLVNFAQIIY